MQRTLIPLLSLTLVLLVACQPNNSDNTNTTADSINDSLDLPDREYNIRATIFEIDQNNSYASYYADELFLEDSAVVIGRNTNEGEFTAVGTTRAVRGELALDLTADPPIVLGGDFAVNLVSLRTNQPHRDDMIRRHWLESELYPVARFTITEPPEISADYIAGEPTTFILKGELTVRDQVVPAEFVTEATLQDDILTGEGIATLEMTDFGFEPPSLSRVVTVENEFRLGIRIRAEAQE